MSPDAFRRLELVVACTGLVAVLAVLAVLVSWWVFFLAWILGPALAIALTVEQGAPPAEPEPVEQEGMSIREIERLHRTTT